MKTKSKQEFLKLLDIKEHSQYNKAATDRRKHMQIIYVIKD